MFARLPETGHEPGSASAQALALLAGIAAGQYQPDRPEPAARTDRGPEG
jgi:hypothetical protein